jgi:mannose-1-phosphate guanylyltransferase / mannose-6-phosphate isomerase
MMRTIIPVIISGGAGTRLWPLSTPDRPKQFHTIAAARSMIQETALRLKGVVGGINFGPPVVVASAAHEALILDQLGAVGVEPALLVLEPEGRNTAAAAAAAAFAVDEIDPGALALVLPSDHLIGHVGHFATAIKRAAAFAESRILTFGISPTGPATGYGYIEAGASLGAEVFAITRFHEKPDTSTAEAYLAAGGFTWNAGIFLFRPGILLEEFKGAYAAIREGVSMAWFGARRMPGVVHLDAAHFGQTPAEAVDIAVMQGTARGAVAPVDMDWADVGSWSEVLRLSEQDTAGNVVEGAPALIDVRKSLVRADGVRLAVVGVEGLVIVATRDGVLVADSRRTEEVKALLAQWQTP